MWDVKCFASDSYLVLALYLFGYLHLKELTDADISKPQSRCLFRN